MDTNFPLIKLRLFWKWKKMDFTKLDIFFLLEKVLFWMLENQFPLKNYTWVAGLVWLTFAASPFRELEHLLFLLVTWKVSYPQWMELSNHSLACSSVTSLLPYCSNTISTLGFDLFWENQTIYALKFPISFPMICCKTALVVCSPWNQVLDR